MGVFQCNVFDNHIFQGPCGVAEEVVAPQVEQQPAGRVYAPVRKRKPGRLVFLERELIEQHERRKELEQQKVRLERRRAGDEVRRTKELGETVAALGALQRIIGQIEADIAAEMALIRMDDEDAIITIVAATIH